MFEPRKPVASAAFAVAVLALAVAFAGVGAGVYAAAKINGSQLKSKSVSGSKLKKDTLTGKQVRESALKGLAASDNFVRVRSQRTVTDAVVVDPLLSLGAVRLSLQCSPGASVWKLLARSDGGPTQYDLVVTSGGGSGDGPSETRGGVTTSTDALILGNSNPPDTDFARVVGTIVFNDDSRKETISVQLAIDLERQGSSVSCSVAGTAVRTAG